MSTAGPSVLHPGTSSAFLSHTRVGLEDDSQHSVVRLCYSEDDADKQTHHHPIWQASEFLLRWLTEVWVGGY